MTVTSGDVLTLDGAIQHKRGTDAALTASGYVPAAGEIVIATDTGEIRGGDGVHSWRDLPSAAAMTHEVVLSTRLTQQEIQQKYLELPNSCDTHRAIRVYLRDKLMTRGNDWEVMFIEGLGLVIAWEERGLETLACVGDKLLVHYWERM